MVESGARIGARVLLVNEPKPTDCLCEVQAHFILKAENRRYLSNFVLR